MQAARRIARGLSGALGRFRKQEMISRVAIGLVVVAPLLSCVSEVAAAEGVTPTAELLAGTDIVVVGVLHDVTVERSALLGVGTGTLTVDEVVVGGKAAKRPVTLRWTEVFDVGLDPRSFGRRDIWFLRRMADGHVETFMNSGHFAADDCASLRDLRKRMESFAGPEAQQATAHAVLKWLGKRADHHCNAGTAQQRDPVAGLYCHAACSRTRRANPPRN